MDKVPSPLTTTGAWTCDAFARGGGCARGAGCPLIHAGPGAQDLSAYGGVALAQAPDWPEQAESGRNALSGDDAEDRQPPPRAAPDPGPVQDRRQGAGRRSRGRRRRAAGERKTAGRALAARLREALARVEQLSGAACDLRRLGSALGDPDLGQKADRLDQRLAAHADQVEALCASVGAPGEQAAAEPASPPGRGSATKPPASTLGGA